MGFINCIKGPAKLTKVSFILATDFSNFSWTLFCAFRSSILSLPNFFFISAWDKPFASNWFICFSLIAYSSPVRLPICSCTNKDFANSSLLNPTAPANASCCILFIFPNSAAEPACLAISLATPAISLFSANCLAFSKLSDLPVSNSASISFAIEDSKLSKLSAMPSTLDISIPKDLAVATAAAICPGFLPNDKVVAADTLLISLSTSFSFSATLNFWPVNRACAMISAVFFSKSPPVAIVILFTPPNSSYVKPAVLCNFWKVIRLASIVVLNIPNSPLTAIKASPNPFVVIEI